MLYLKLFLIAVIASAFSSCFPDNTASTRALAGPVQSVIINNKVAKLDKYLAGPIENKRIMEETARKIKADFPNQPEVLRKGEVAYNVSLATLKSLKNSIKNDIRTGGNTFSKSTSGYAERYAKDVGNLRDVYADASGVQDKSMLLGAWGVLHQAFAVWSNYDSAKKDALIENVDYRLGGQSWNTLQ